MLCYFLIKEHVAKKTAAYTSIAAYIRFMNPKKWQSGVLKVRSLVIADQDLKYSEIRTFISLLLYLKVFIM